MALFDVGAIRTSFSKGNMTRSDCLAMHPFENCMMPCEYSGKPILEALEHGAAGEKQPVPGSFGLQVWSCQAGRQPVGKRIVNVELLDTEGSYQKKRKKYYGVIPLSCLDRGGGGHTCQRK